MTQAQDILFSLLRSAIGTSAESIPTDFSDWEAVINMAFEQGVDAVSVDGYNASLSLTHPTREDAEIAIETEELEDLKFEWFGSVLQEEEEYRRQKEAIAHLASVYRKEGIRMTLLKGLGLSECYPVPEHRQVGDIDIFLSYIPGESPAQRNGKPAWKAGDEIIKGLGITVDYSHHHHSVFQWQEQAVDNHFDFVNIHSHLSGRRVEKRLKALAAAPGTELWPGVYLPSPNLAALFTARHAAIHFASGELELRQLLDWPLLIRKIENRIDWPVFWQDVRMMGMLPFVLVMVQVATESLGMDISLFHLPEGLRPDASLARKVLDDTLSRDRNAPIPKGFVRYWRWMLHRWWQSRWKHRLVYTDSLTATFLVQILSHLMKPESLRR